MVCLAQHRDWIALGLAVELREHRTDPLDALDQPARRHRGSAVEQQLERGEIGLVQRRMVQQHVDHGRHEQGEVDALALDGFQHRARIEPLEHVHGAAAHQRRQHLGAGDVADRRHREIARVIGNFEVGQDRVGEAAVFPMIAQRAFGFSGGAARVIQRRDIVGTGKTMRAGSARVIDRGKQIDAVIGGAEREDGFQAGRPGCEVAPAIAERIGVNDQHLRFGILNLKQLIVERPQGMQPGDRKPQQLRGDARTPGVGAVGGEERHARARLQAELHEYFLHTPDQFGRALVGDRSVRPAECDPRRIARQRPQRLPADGRKGIQRIGHVSSSWLCRLLCLGPSVVPMLPNASIMNPRRGTANRGASKETS